MFLLIARVGAARRSRILCARLPTASTIISLVPTDEYVTYGRKIKRMGAHASTALITVLVELLCIYKWSADEFPAPAPRCVPDLSL